MDWQSFRKSYKATHGRATQQDISNAYKQYKTEGVEKPPRRLSPRPSPVRGRSPIRHTASRLSLRDIEKQAKDKEFYIVVLYANWCGHCQAMKQQLGDKMQNRDKIVFIEESQLAPGTTDFFPHVLYFEKGIKQPDLTVNDVYSYMNIKPSTVPCTHLFCKV